MPGKIGVRLSIPHLQGAYLALNAIADAYFLGDGPSCLFAKAEHINGRHDLFSTLLSCESEHRVHYTGVNVFNIAGNFEGEIAAALKRIASWPGCGALFMGSMPMCTIAGTDYERILREALSGGGKPYFLVPRDSSVSGDWIDGYAAVLEVLAAKMDIKGAKPAADSVAVVGYMMDRNEGEHRGNVAELERMLRAVDLDPVSIWLSGRPFEELRRARFAKTIVSLPHGRKAGKMLARRLGVKLIEAELPFGLEASRRFMELVGRECGRKARAQAFVKSELDEVVPRLEWSVPHAFLHRRFAFAGDPHYAVCFAEIVADLGGELLSMNIMGGTHHLTPVQRKRLEGLPQIAFEPMVRDVEKDWGAVTDQADLYVTNTLVLEAAPPKTAWIEFGFPSEYTHFLSDEPFLGFQGALGFISRAANELIKGRYVNRPQARRPGAAPAAPEGRT